MVTNEYLTKITFPKTGQTNHIQTYTYGYNDGELTMATDQNGQSTTYRYNDSLDRITETDYPDNGQTMASYNDLPSSLSETATRLVTNGTTVSATSLMDGLGHLTQTQLTTDPDGPTYSFTSYDGLGKMYQAWNPTRCSNQGTNCKNETTWGVTTYLYDDLGRTKSVTEPDNSIVGTTYSANTSCSLTTVTDEALSQRSSCADSFGRLTSVQEAPNNPGYNYVTSYQYDSLNDLLVVTQYGSDSSNARVRNFGYNSLGQLASASNPESGTLIYTYDANGNVSSKAAPAPNGASGAVTTYYQYDALNRLVEKTYSVSWMPSIVSGYDGVVPSNCSPAPPSLTDSYATDRRTSMCDGSGATSWSHDKMGRVASEAQTQNSNITESWSYSYNLDGSVNQITYPSGNVLNYTVGGAGRVTQANDSNNTYMGGAANTPMYAPQGAILNVANGSSILTSNAYNPRLQPTTLSAANSSQTIFSLSYGFNPGSDNGNVVQIANGVRSDATSSLSFAYDPLNRIQQANTTTTGNNCWGEVYTIDAWSNLTNIAGVQTMPNCNMESLNNPVNNTNNQITGYCYDLAGNLLDKGACAGASHSFVYDVEGQLQSPPVSGLNSGIAYTYFYDGDGNRVQKCDANPCTNAGSPGTLYWRGIGGEVLDESSRTGAMQEEYVYFDGRRIARRDIGANTVHYYFSDYLGSASVITDSNGNVQEQTDFYPFGGIAYTSGGDPNHYKFTGKERDSESGLDNFGARYNASSLGRFMTPDPIGGTPLHIINPQRWNMYAYVMNNPLTYIDPDGRDAAVATFHNMVLGAGHAGIISIHGDGTATYARTGPAVASMPVWKASTPISYDLPTVQFGQDGYPTPASIDALTDKVAGIEGEDPDSVAISYYKTSEADTIQLDNLIQDEHDHPGWYNVFLRNCEDFCDRALRSAGRNPGSGFFHALTGYIPNLAWYMDIHADRQYNHKTKKQKESVTHKICWVDQGKQHCE